MARYFSISYMVSTKIGFGFGEFIAGIQCGFPSLGYIKESIKHEGSTGRPIITSIYEFKNEDDYNDYIAEECPKS